MPAVFSLPQPKLVIFTSDEMFERGLEVCGHGGRYRSGNKQQLRRFMASYGSDPIVLAQIWEDLQTTHVDEARMKLTPEHLDHFLMSHYFVKQYPVEEVLAGVFNYCEKTCRKWCWEFLTKMQQLKKEKIVWPEEWTNPDDPNTPTLLYSVDGVHCRIPEPKHPTLSKNPKYYSHKDKNPGLSYELALSLWESKIVWVKGPAKASQHDITTFRDKKNTPSQGLKQKTPKGKRGIADKAYRGEKKILSVPNSHDPPDLRKFKSRSRARQEALNARIKVFNVLNNRFRHGIEKHQIVFEAVCVIVQYQFDNGSPLFDV